MEYFQRSNLPPPKWMRESHSTRQLHLIKVNFQDPTTGGKEVTLYADRYFRSVKDAEHNTSILVLCHLMPGVKEPKDIIDRMTQLQNLSKMQKRRRQEGKPLRMGAYAFKNKMYSRTPAPGTLYGTPTAAPGNRSKGTVSQFDNYGYGYDYSLYDQASYGQAVDSYNLYNAYYQAGYGYDYSSYGSKSGQDTQVTPTNYPSATSTQRGYDNTHNPYSQITENLATNSSIDRNSNPMNAYTGQGWYTDTNSSNRTGYTPITTNYPSQYSQAGYTSY